MAKPELLQKPGIVYLITNKVNGKKYVGVTSRRYLSIRKCEHFQQARKGLAHMIILKAIRKYGEENFIFSILKKCETFKEALEEEKKFIEFLKPEYNSTKGGEGALGHIVSQEARKKISDKNKGKQSPMAGKTHSDEVKDILRRLAIKQNNLSKYGHMGPKASSRAVICLDDGKIHGSASAAARYYGSCKSAIIELCLGKNFRKTVNGRRFEYVNIRSARESSIRSS